MTVAFAVLFGGCCAIVPHIHKMMIDSGSPRAAFGAGCLGNRGGEPRPAKQRGCAPSGAATTGRTGESPAGGGCSRKILTPNEGGAAGGLPAQLDGLLELRPCEPFAIVVLKLRLGVIKRRCATIRFDAGMARTDHDDRPEPRCICRRWRAVSVNSADLSATIDDGVILVI